MSYIREFLIFLFIFISFLGWGLIIISIINKILLSFHVEKIAFDSSVEEIYFLIPFGMGFVSILFFFIGIAKLYYQGVALIVLSIGSLRALPKLIDFFKILKLLRKIQDLHWQTTILAIIFGTSAVSSLLYIFIVNTLIPPIEWDELAYHLAVPKIFINAHGITYLPSILQSNWPMGVQMLFTASLLLKGELATHMITFLMAVLAGTGILLLSSKFFDWKTGWIACSIFLNIPLVYRLSGTGLIDIALSFYTVPVLISFFNFQRTRKVFWLVICGVMCGFIASTKQTGIILAIIIAFLILVNINHPEIHIKRKFTYILILGVISLLISLPWFIKNMVYTNDPLFPFLYRFFGGNNWDIKGSEYFQEVWRVIYMELPRNFSGLVTSINYLYLKPERLGGYGGGIGKVPLSFYFLGLILAIIYRKKTPTEIYYLILLIVLFYTFWFFFASLEIRYLFPIFIPVSIIAGYTVNKIGEFTFHISKNHALQSFLFISINIPLAYFLLNNTLLFSQVRMNVLHSRAQVVLRKIPKQDFLNHEVDVLPVFQYVNQNLPLNAKILLLPYENRGYYLDRQYVLGHPANQRYIRFEEFQTPNELASYVHTLGIDYVLYNPTWIFSGYENWEHDHKLMLDLIDNCGEIIFRHNNATLYKLQPCLNRENQ